MLVKIISNGDPKETLVLDYLTGNQIKGIIKLQINMDAVDPENNYCRLYFKSEGDPELEYSIVTPHFVLGEKEYHKYAIDV